MFVVFDGIDGVGKTTQVNLLRDALRLRQISVTAVREPGGESVAEDIRGVILRYGIEDTDPLTDFLLFCASRAQVVSKTIIPALQRGDVVLSDRYLPSSYAYQGFGRCFFDTEPDWFIETCMVSAQYLIPDITFLFHSFDHEYIMRLRADKTQKDPRDREEKAFYERVLRGYDAFCHTQGHWTKELYVIDPAQTREDIYAEIFSVLKTLG